MEHAPAEHKVRLTHLKKWTSGCQD